jgi:hypothetical protein
MCASEAVFNGTSPLLLMFELNSSTNIYITPKVVQRSLFISEEFTAAKERIFTTLLKRMLAEYQMDLKSVPTANGTDIACVHEEPTPCSAACTQRTLGEEFSSTHFSTFFHSTVQHFPPSMIYARRVSIMKTINDKNYIWVQKSEDTTPCTTSQVQHHYHRIKCICAYSQNV